MSRKVNINVDADGCGCFLLALILFLMAVGGVKIVFDTKGNSEIQTNSLKKYGVETKHLTKQPKEIL